MRKLLIMRESWNLPQDDRDIINSILDNVEKDRQIDHVAARAVIARNWIKRKDHVSVRTRKARRFDATLTAVRESCASITDMEVPGDLERDAIIEAIASLSTSVEQISKLMRKLVGGRE